MAAGSFTPTAGKIQEYDITAKTVTATGNTTLCEILVPHDATRLNVEVVNAGASNAFDVFIVSRKLHSAGSYEVVANAAGDFTSPIHPLISTSGSPVTLAAAGVFHMSMDVEGCSAVKLEASNATADGSANAYISLH